MNLLQGFYENTMHRYRLVFHFSWLEGEIVLLTFACKLWHFPLFVVLIDTIICTDKNILIDI